MSKHHVKVHTWVEGVLNTVIHEFETLELANIFADRAHRQHLRKSEQRLLDKPAVQVVKIYNSDSDELVSTHTSQPQDLTYA